jgi:tetratricopeptide (TPR) repeat protein
MADRAVNTESSRTAHFNRGLALESLHLYQEATTAWEDFLGVETDPGWRDEAEEHLNRCQSANRRLNREEVEAALLGPGVAPDSVNDLVSAVPSHSRRLVLAELLSGARAGGGAEGRATAIAAAVEEVTSDPSLVAEVSLARAAGRGSEELYRLYGLARHHYEAFDIELAFDAFTQAQRQVAHPNCPLDLWIEYYRAVCRYWFGDLELAREMLVNLANRVPVAWLDLRGHIHWMLGLITANQGSPVAALDLYRQAFDVFAGGSFRQEAAFLRVLMAEELLELGDTEGAMAHLLGALADADWILRPSLARGLYERAAEAARRVGCPEVALYFEDRTLQAAERVRDPLVAAEGYYLRSLTRLELGDQVGARTDLEAARKWQGEIADPYARRMVEAGIRLAESRLPERPRQESMESLSRAIANIEDQGASAVLPTLLYERGIRRLDFGDPFEARADLKEAARLLVSQTLSRPGELATRWKREQIRDVFGSLADLLDADDAVAHSLVGRRLELNGTVDSLDRTVAELRRRWMTVDPSSAVIATRFAGDHLIVWLAHGGRSERLSLPFPLGQAEALFPTLLRNRGSAEADVALTRIAERLEPLLTAIRSTRATRLFWIQDVPLMGFPVAALLDPHTGEPLIRDYTIVMVQHLAAPLSSKLNRDWSDASFFGVGDPDLNSASVLPPLPLARREVEEIARPGEPARTGRGCSFRVMATTPCCGGETSSH